MKKNNLDELKKKFNCVITNPPYNSKRSDNNQSVDIYPDFVDKAVELTDRYVIMITKSNWMNFPSHKKFREKMINGYNVDKIIHYSKNPFKGADIQGGVSYFVIDNQNTKDTFKLNDVVYDRKTALNFLPYELNSKELKFLNKIMNLKKISMDNYRSKGFYNIKSNDSRLIKENKDGYVFCHVSKLKGENMYFPISEFNEKIKKDYDKYKVFTTSSYGVPNKLGRVLIGKNELNSESLVNWIFDTEEEMYNWYNYINTKLFRVCVSMIKNKKDVSKITFSLIPHIDFSKLEKVDDENIYKYLNLTDEDIQTIEERCEKLKLIK